MWTNPRLPRVVIADQIQQLDSKVQLSSDRLLVKMGAITPPFLNADFFALCLRYSSHEGCSLFPLS